MKIGARIAHLAEADPTKRFTTAEIAMIPRISTMPSWPWSSSAPRMARMAPMLDALT